MTKDSTSVLAELKSLFGDLAGQNLSTADPEACFFDLGFDSLLLTQVAGGVKQRFGVKVTFRQLIQNFTTLQALATHLEGASLKRQEANNTPLSPGRVEVAAGHSSATLPAGQGSVLERVVDAQLKLMELQLAVLRKSPAAVAGVASSNSPAADTAPVAQHGPFRPIQKTATTGLGETQKKYLADFTRRYVARSPKSKAYTQAHRSHFADPRAVSGFNPNWKEMVYPIVSARSSGAHIWDIDGNRWVDVTMGFGVALLGHSPGFVSDALRHQIDLGVEIGPQSPLAGEVAGMVAEMTGTERVTFCNTGSEAVMAAIRLCRTVTGRTRIVLFAGAYHGTFDEVLVKSAWLGDEPRTLPLAPGVAGNLVSEVTVLEYGAARSIDWIRTHVTELAAVLVEPVQSRHPGLQPREFLHEVRRITEQADTPLIIDEVITGFRCHPGGAQAYFGLRADLVTYGKVIGGGMPFGLIAGRRKYLDALDGGQWQYNDDSFPEIGVTFFAGTFVRHPLAMAAARVMLTHLKERGPSLQEDLAARTASMVDGLNRHFARVGAALELERFTSIWYPHFGSDVKYGSLLYYHLREKGLHIWEGRPCFLSTAHTDEDLAFIVNAFEQSVAEMQSAGFLPKSTAIPAAAPLPIPTEAGSSPVTEAQREMFLSVQMGPEASCSCNEALILRFDGPLDEAALRTALFAVIERHPSLRSTFAFDGETQLFHPTASMFSLSTESLEDLPPDEAEIRFGALSSFQTKTPFDLVNGPLLRLKLVRFGHDRHRLLITAHHIVCDGWSFGMVVAELGALYSAARRGGGATLPPAMPFGDFARLQAAEADSLERKEAEAYWIRIFENGAPVLALPTDRPRPLVKTYGGAMETRLIDATRCARLKKVTASLGGTLFSTLFAAFGAFLHRLTGQDDIVIGVPAAGQTMVGCNELVGHCVNFLPIRLHPHGELPFSRFAREVKQVVLDAYDHQDFTYGTLVRKLHLPRDTSRLPLVSVTFNIDKSGFELAEFAGIKVEVLTNPKQFSNFELFFNLVQTDQSLEVECEYNTDLFDATTIRGWLESFESMVEQVITDGDTTLARLPLRDTSKHAAEPAQTAAPTTQARDTVTAPPSETETVLAGIWQEVLRRPVVGVNDDFFDIGGDSLSSFRITQRANAAGLPVTSRLLFEHRTIARLAQNLPATGSVTAGPVRNSIPRIARNIPRAGTPRES